MSVPKMLFELICYMLKPSGDLFARTHMLNAKNKQFVKNWDIKETDKFRLSHHVQMGNPGWYPSLRTIYALTK